MKDLKAILLGFASCLLLAAGYARAGEHLDPLSAQQKTKVSQGTVQEEPAAIPCFENGGSYDGPGTSWSGDDDGKITYQLLDPEAPVAPH